MVIQIRYSNWLAGLLNIFVLFLLYCTACDNPSVFNLSLSLSLFLSFSLSLSLPTSPFQQYFISFFKYIFIGLFNTFLVTILRTGSGLELSPPLAACFRSGISGTVSSLCLFISLSTSTVSVSLSLSPCLSFRSTLYLALSLVSVSLSLSLLLLFQSLSIPLSLSPHLPFHIMLYLYLSV